MVDDGSIKNKFSRTIFNEAKISGTLITLKANYGHQVALCVGLEWASKMESHAVVTMDSDGEDNPLNIERLV